MAELLGADGGDVLGGADGDDTVVGGRGADTLSGGAGVNAFVIDNGDSPATSALFDQEPQVDVITDWSADDRLIFVRAQPPEPDSLFAGVASSYGGAYDLAQDAFAGGFEYASIKVGADVYVFAPRTDSVVRLAGADPADVTRAAFSADMTGGEDATLSVAADQFAGGAGADTVHGLEGADTLTGGDGADRVFGGGDNDSVDGGDGANYLRGEAGDDAVTGGAQHDDINGNMGRDTLDAGAGDDWVRGGKDDDVVLAGAGNDLAFGDLGSDTVGGGLGDDLLHGGDGEDIVRGDDGNDTLMGDLGRDTLDGGLGADVIVAQAEAGDDRVIAFNAAEGDHVLMPAGMAYSLSQDGDDTVIEMGGGRMVLAGVQLSSLPDGWLVVT